MTHHKIMNLVHFDCLYSRNWQQGNIISDGNSLREFHVYMVIKIIEKRNSKPFNDYECHI